MSAPATPLRLVDGAPRVARPKVRRPRKDETPRLTEAEVRQRATLTVPEAGRFGYDLSYSASFEAMHRGIIPVIKRSQNRYVVPVAAFLRSLGMEP